jgi:hypothetical protein
VLGLIGEFCRHAVRAEEERLGRRVIRQVNAACTPPLTWVMPEASALVARHPWNDLLCARTSFVLFSGRSHASAIPWTKATTADPRCLGQSLKPILDGQTVPIERGARCARESRLGRQSPWRGARDSPVTHRRSIRSAKLEIPTRTVPLRLVRGRHREADLSSGAAVEHPELSDAIRASAGHGRLYDAAACAA